MSAGVGVGLMVVAEQMERAVDDEMRRMLVDAHAFLGRFACAHAMGQDDVAEHDRGAIVVRLLELVRLGHREGQDVGRLVLAAPMGVQPADLIVAGRAAPTARRGGSIH